MSLDTAFETKKTSSYNACTVWGEIRFEDSRDKRYYLLNSWRLKAEYPVIKRKIIQTYNEYNTGGAPVVILLEDKATGKSLRQELTPLGMSIVPVTPVSDKLTRACSVTSQFESGRVFVADGEQWADDFIAGLAAYPAGNWGDIADTVSQAIAWMSQSHFISEKLLNKLVELGGKQSQVNAVRSQLEGLELPYRGIFRFGRN